MTDLRRSDVTPLPKAGPKKPARRRPLPLYSEKRFSAKELRAALVAQVLERDGHRCRARLLVPSIECGGPLEVHEKCARDVWADGYLVEWNTVTLCQQHHRWTTDHPTEAHRVGLHLYSWEVEHRVRRAVALSLRKPA